MARIKTQILIPAYMNASRPKEVEAYMTHGKSRFAVAKVTDKAWDLRHIKSGLSIGSLLPPRKLSVNEMLGVVRAIEAHTELDLSHLDSAAFGKGFDPAKPPPTALIETMRTIAAAALV